MIRISCNFDSHHVAVIPVATEDVTRFPLVALQHNAAMTKRKPDHVNVVVKSGKRISIPPGRIKQLVRSLEPAGSY